MAMNISPPSRPQGSATEQLERLYSYLFRMTEELNLALVGVESSGRDMLYKAVSGEEKTGGKVPSTTAEAYQQLKALVIKTATDVTSNIRKMVTEISQAYVAQSEYGTYSEYLNAIIEASAGGLAATWDAENKLVVPQSGVFDEYTAVSKLYMKLGIVGENEDGTLEAGVVIGTDLKKVTVDGRDYITSQNVYSVLTSDSLSFWQNGVKKAKVSLTDFFVEKMYVEEVVAEIVNTDAVYAKIVEAVEAHFDSIVVDDLIDAETVKAAAAEAVEAKIGTAIIKDAQIESLDGSKIKAGTVTAQQLAAKTVTAQQLAAKTVTAEKLATGSVTADAIKAGSVGTDKLAAKAVTAGKVDIDDLFAAEATIQALNAADISGNESLHMYVGGKIEGTDAEVAALRTEINLIPGKIQLAVSEIDEFHAGTTVDITKDEFRVSTPEFVVDIVDDDGETSMLSIDENGARMQSLACPDVAPRYNGPATLNVNKSATSAQIAAGTHYRSIADAAAALSNRWIGKNVVVYVAAGTVEYGTVTLQGAYGSGSIYIIGDETSPAKLVGMVQILYCGCPVFLRYLNVDSASGGVGIDCAGSATMAIIENCVITGKGVSVAGGRGVRVLRGAHADVHGCELYDHERSLYAQQTGTIRAYNNKGNCRVAADGGTIYASGSMPCDTPAFAYGAYAGQVIMATDITVNGNAATPPAVETTPTTVNVTANATDSWYSASGAWLNQDNVIRQGYYSGMGEWSGCFWFPTASFSGKTVKTASLTLTRTAGSGKSGEVTLTLYGITIASASGNPNSGRVSYGALGTIGNGETKTFTLPAAAAQALAKGTIKGFMLYAGDGKVMSGRSYSTNYCKIGSSGSVLPKLSVTY